MSFGLTTKAGGKAAVRLVQRTKLLSQFKAVVEQEGEGRSEEVYRALIHVTPVDFSEYLGLAPVTRLLYPNSCPLAFDPCPLLFDPCFPPACAAYALVMLFLYASTSTLLRLHGNLDG
jgi:hypothetical protein